MKLIKKRVSTNSLCVLLKKSIKWMCVCTTRGADDGANRCNQKAWWEEKVEASGQRWWGWPWSSQAQHLELFVRVWFMGEFVLYSAELSSKMMIWVLFVCVCSHWTSTFDAPFSDYSYCTTIEKMVVGKDGSPNTIAMLILLFMVIFFFWAFTVRFQSISRSISFSFTYSTISSSLALFYSSLSLLRWR